MKLRHAAALALVGWYLISPPRVAGSPPQWRIDDTAPVSRWDRGGTYFSNREKCEAYRLLNIDRARHFQMASPEWEYHYETAERSFCINEDDPLLEPFGGPPWRNTA